MKAIHNRHCGTHRNVLKVVSGNTDASDRRRRKRKYRADWMRMNPKEKYSVRDLYECMVYILDEEERVKAKKEAWQ